MWNNIKRSNIQIIGVPEIEKFRQRKLKKLAKSYQNLANSINFKDSRCSENTKQDKFKEHYRHIMGFPGGSDGKEFTCNAGDLGSVPGLGRSPGGGHGNPLQYLCLENPDGPRSLVGCSPWDRKESDTTEQLSTAQHTDTS